MNCEKQYLSLLMTDTTLNETSKQTATEWLVKLQSPHLTETQQQSFFAWLDQAPEHQTAYIEAESLWESLAALEQLPPTAADIINLKPVARPWYSRPQAVAASLVGIVALLFLQFMPTAGNTEYQTAIGEQRKLILDDGSRIHLNTHSTLRVNFQSDKRLVTMIKGEAFFDVSKDAQRPFVIETPEGLVRVLGTSFNIRIDNTKTIVAVVEGKVGVAPLAAANEVASPVFEPLITLTANQQLVLADGNINEHASSVDAIAATTWRQGKQIYNGVALAEVIRDLNRYYVGEVKLDDPAMEDIQAVAVLDLRDRASAIAALESTFNVIAVQKSPELIVLHSAK